MLWGVAFTVLIVALMIPMIAVLRDARGARGGSPLPSGDHDARIDQLTRRVQLLEDELDDMGRVVDQLRDDSQFLQQLLEDPDRREERPPPPRPNR